MESLALRIGKLEVQVDALKARVEKFNPCHESSTGRFCSTKGGAGGGGWISPSQRRAERAERERQRREKNRRDWRENATPQARTITDAFEHANWKGDYGVGEGFKEARFTKTRKRIPGRSPGGGIESPREYEVHVAPSGSWKFAEYKLSRTSIPGMRFTREGTAVSSKSGTGLESLRTHLKSHKLRVK